MLKVVARAAHKHASGSVPRLQNVLHWRFHGLIIQLLIGLEEAVAEAAAGRFAPVDFGLSVF
ncbi:hypothetical protein C7I85_24735 [Mesorhizobium soli]|uniref:Uncharacterized protein n=1 Tax=Pseudaminobacter soli (ex Li et al. 2025) TaxID=1295366 RepID=A0A2P7S1X8_9HYPH|nr:hypothetical protein C7I85_24735 [Mesorhizobium soli]